MQPRRVETNAGVSVVSLGCLQYDKIHNPNVSRARSPLPTLASASTRGTWALCLPGLWVRGTGAVCWFMHSALWPGLSILCLQQPHPWLVQMLWNSWFSWVSMILWRYWSLELQFSVTSLHPWLYFGHAVVAAAVRSCLCLRKLFKFDDIFTFY